MLFYSVFHLIFKKSCQVFLELLKANVVQCCCLHFQYLYEFGWHSKGIIGVTQPRRVSAMTVADRIANERGEVLGDTVGVSVSFIDKCTESTQIKVRMNRDQLQRVKSLQLIVIFN